MPITAAATPLPAAMAAVAGKAAVSVTARTVTAATVGRASEKEVHMDQEARAGEHKLGAGETDSKAFTDGKDHERGGRCTRR